MILVDSLVGFSLDILHSLTLHSSSAAIIGREAVEASILDILLQLADRLVEEGVALVGCQKCVHPLVKERLRQHVCEFV